MSSPTYSITLFKELIEKYPTWPEFRSYVESQNLLVNFETEAETSRYCIIRYNKKVDKSNEIATSWKKWFRSVVWDTETNRPVCIAPKKANEGDKPVDAYEEEYLDGFMINAWTTSGVVQIATRSSIGATGTFHSKKPFSVLFKEALGSKPVDSCIEGEYTFTSFNVQHPENRIVSPVDIPCVWAIHSGFVQTDGTVVIHENKDLPKPVSNPTWKNQGTIYKDGNGNRWRVRNPAYLMVKSLRGNEVRPDVRYVRLRQQRLIDTYVYYFPEEKEMFNKYEDGIKSIIETLYTLYVDVHIAKKEAVEIDPMYKPHIYALHGYYLNSLKEKGFFIRRKEVKDYVDKLPWQRLVFLLTRSG
jgi:hypothetical protein